MKKVWTADSLILITHFKNILEAEGIRAEIRNQHLGSILGEMPFGETWPELWVYNDLEADRATQLIKDAATEESPPDRWSCPACGQDNEPHFGACWKCGAAATV